MIHNVLSLLRMLKAVALVTYKEWAAYRSHMLLSLVVGPVFFLAQVFIWTAVYAGRNELGGFTLEQMLLYYGVSSIIYYLIMDFADWNLQMLIRTGKFLTYVLRPMPHPFFAFSQKIGHRILGFLFEFIPVWLIFFFLFHIKLIPAGPSWTIVSVMFSFVIMFLLNYSIGILAFWLTRTDGIRALIRLFRDLMAGVFIPLSFFPDAIQKILFFLPFQFVSYVPTRVFLGSYTLAGWNISIPLIVGIQGLALIGMLIVTATLWRLGIKRFTGVGA
ncbi:MAG: ABC transporter permease [Fibrobacterota bacterium]